MSKATGKVIKIKNGAAVKSANDARSESLVQDSSRSVFVRMPGRIEVAGNHVDHQGGRALTATIDRFITIHAAPNDTSTIHIASPGFADTIIDANDIEPHPEERFTSAAIVRGVVAALNAQGIEVGGFDADVTSTIPVGRGLSSSAAYELALVSTIAKLFGGGALDPEVRVKAAFMAEQEFFGKPCGAMDQRA
ncbi:MAG: galactokinase family protein, partial [Eggerthellaceae bacterium]|nr:galactokinase family protein [Eggerthellaceae bacterium]